jgi:hypothetical protein
MSSGQFAAAGWLAQPEVQPDIVQEMNRAVAEAALAVKARMAPPSNKDESAHFFVCVRSAVWRNLV